MKNYIFVAVVAVAVSMSSCFESKYETTPVVGMDSVIVVNKKDTAKVRFVSNKAIYMTDTLLTGDTALMTVLFDAVGNNLKQARIVYESEYAKAEAVYPAEWEEWMTPAISKDSISFSVVDGYRAVVMQLRYIPQKEGSPILKLHVGSDSEYSPREFQVTTPIKQGE